MELEASNIYLHYHRQKTKIVALNGINLYIPAGSSLGITGPSGSGKSSLLYVLSGLRQPTSGEVKVDGVPIQQAVRTRLLVRQRHFGFIFQQHLLLNYLTVVENIRVTALKSISNRPIEERLAYLIDLLGLKGLENAFPFEISVGQRQRVAVARALINEPAVVFADEPTASLDQQHAKQVMELLDDYRRQWRTTLIAVSHDRSLLSGMDRLLVLDGGRADENIGSGIC